MHFYLATLFMLVPLLAAAPTPNIEQRVPPVDVSSTVKSGLEQVAGTLNGPIGNLATGNAKRQAADIVEALAAALKLASSVDPKLQSGKRNDGIDVIKTANEILKPVSDFKYPDASANEPNDKRNDGVDVIKTVNEILKPVSDFKYPDASANKPNDKRNDGVDVIKTVNEILKPVSDFKYPDGSINEPNGKRN